MKYFFNLCLIVSFLQGCVNNIKTSLPTYNEITSSVLILEEDTMLVYITDFFPTMEKVDSITSSSLSIIPGVNPAEQFLAVSRESTPALNTIDFWNNGDKVSIIARKKNNLFNGKRLSIFTTAENEKSFEVTFTKQPDQLLIFWQNMELPLSLYTWEKGRLTVLVPAEAALLERSFIRVIAAAQGVISNDLLIPLHFDKVLNHIKELKRSDKP